MGILYVHFCILHKANIIKLNLNVLCANAFIFEFRHIVIIIFKILLH